MTIQLVVRYIKDLEGITLQIVRGIFPVRLLFEAKKYDVDNGGIGSDPCNMLECKSKM